MEQLIFLGDHVRFSQELGKVANITSINKSVVSTAEDLTDIELLYNRVSINIRVSKNDEFYSDWYDLKDIELSNTLTYSDIYTNSEVNSTLQIEFKLLSIPDNWDEETDNISVSLVDVETSQSIQLQQEQIPNPPVLSAVGNNSYVFNENFTYNPYNLGNLGTLQNDLSLMVNQVYGHNVEYIKVNPLKKGEDFIYHEWNLYGAGEDDVKCLKLLILNNEFQTTNGFLFNQFGVNFTENIEAHLDHNYFQKLYGADKIPQEHDIIYIPFVNRMYEVSGTVPVRNVNQKVQYWKMTLVKYEKRSNVLLDTETKTKIDENALGLEDLFSPMADKEATNISIEKQTQMNKLQNEHIRSFVNPRIGYSKDLIQSYFNIVSENQYNINNLYSKDRTLAVTYKQNYENKIDVGTSLSFISSLYQIKNNSVNISLVDEGSDFKLTLTTGVFSPQIYSVGGLLTLYNRTGNSKTVKGYVKILEIADDNTYLIVKKLNNFTNNNVSLMSNTLRRDVVITGLNTYNRQTKIRSFIVDDLPERFSVSILDNHSIFVEYFGSEYLFYMNDVLEFDNYYGFVVALNSEFRTISASVYEFNNMDSGDDLVEYYSETKPFVNNNKTSNGVLSLVGSPIKLTNVRLFNKPLDSDLHKQYLTSMYVKNDSDLLIYDNCEPESLLNDFDYNGRLK